MILLAANAGAARNSLASFLENEGLSTKTCSTVAEAAALFLKAPTFELTVVEYRVGNQPGLNLIGELERKGRAVPFIVLGAPLKAEAELYRRGALAVVSAGFSPRSVALQCLSLSRFLARRPFQVAKAKAATNDFTFGAVKVSPERRTLSARGKSEPVSLSRLQLRILQALHDAPAKIIDYESLYHAIWRRAYRGNNAAIREAVSSLRDRLRQAGAEFDDHVTTVYGEGYRYEGK